VLEIIGVSNFSTVETLDGFPANCAKSFEIFKSVKDQKFDTLVLARHGLCYARSFVCARVYVYTRVRVRVCVRLYARARVCVYACVRTGACTRMYAYGGVGLFYLQMTVTLQE
jgi:hypothetical protein